MKLGQPLSVGSKFVKSSPKGSVRRVPTKIALTLGCCCRYSPNASFIGLDEEARDRWYCAEVCRTNSSTSKNELGCWMYTDANDVGKPVECCAKSVGFEDKKVLECLWSATR